ncbi:hypothetical protein [Nocardiopsis sp. M1B1]
MSTIDVTELTSTETKPMTASAATARGRKRAETLVGIIGPFRARRRPAR